MEGSIMPEEGSRNAIIVDTSVLIHDPDSVDFFLNGGGNTIFIPWVVVEELDKLQNKPNIGYDAKQAIDRITGLQARADRADCFRLVKSVDIDAIPFLSSYPSRPEHQLLAIAKDIASDASKRKGFKKVKLVTRNPVLRLFAANLGDDLDLVVEDYHRNQAQGFKDRELKHIDVSWADIDISTMTFEYDEEKYGEINHNEGVVCVSDNEYPNLSKDENKPNNFTAIRKGKKMYIIPRDISCMGLTPLSNNGEPNWWQHIAMHQLLDPDIQLVFLRGGAGTGKTLLAIAAGIENRIVQKQYKQIVISRPMIHLEDEDRMGFLPGSMEEKMDPWMVPVHHALGILKTTTGSNKRNNHKIITEMMAGNKISLQPLDYIRGVTYFRTYIVIDEAQNLTPHQVKTIITRAGLHTKIVFTGDLDQIDRHGMLDKRSSGLAYATEKMMGQTIVGVTTFSQTVRSPLAGLGEKLL